MQVFYDEPRICIQIRLKPVSFASVLHTYMIYVASIGNVYVEELSSLLKLVTVISVEAYLAWNVITFFLNYKLEGFFFYFFKKEN